MRTRRVHVPAFLLLAVVLSMAASCPKQTGSPQAVIAHHGTAVINAVADLQRGVTAGAVASPAFVPTAQKITAVVEKIYEHSGTLGDALRVYDAATTIDLRRLADVKVQEEIAAINKLLVEAFGIKISDAAGQEVAGLIANVAKFVATLSLEMSKLKAPQ